MNAETLAKVAKGLGAVVRNGKIVRIRHYDGDEDYIGFTDGDLLLAILNRAAELGYSRNSWNYHGCNTNFESVMVADGKTYSGEADSELEAAALAFSELPECQP